MDRQDAEISNSTAATDAAAHSQYGALCWRRIGVRLEVLLITSRETGRWVIPKGWPISGLAPEASAAQEAYEEAGVEGSPTATCIGLYAYDKALDRLSDEPSSLPCVVAVYPLQVKTLRDRFPERGQRRRKWFSPKKAARKVAEAELQGLLAGLEALLPETGGKAGKAGTKLRAPAAKA
ncbi:MAG: NUDIX hydrolase [Pseudorhodobacter sp.]|nr:NUDIX hydrolase [Pseudorhodobacter sp.]